METLLYNIGQVLGITLLHSSWQGLLIYAIIRLGFIAFPAASAVKKYNTLYAALMVLAVWFGYTFFMEAKAYNWTTPVEQHFTLVKDVPLSNTTITQPTPIDQPFYYSYKALVKAYLPYISALYVIGVLINLVRLAMGWQNIRRIKKQATAADIWQQLTDNLTKRAGIIKHVQVSFSSVVDVPCAFGYLKPIILLPVSISTQLSAEEIEMIILHELAHIKNNDYTLNLIQQIIALLLFLNPFAQLISRMIDVERENRCDDTVLQIGDPLTYAGALVKLEKTRQSNLQLALPATGKKYHLFARIKRIMSDDKPVVNIKHLVFGLLIFIGGVVSIAWLNPEIKDGKLVSKNGAAAVQQLAKMVKEVITTKKLDLTVPQAKHPKLAINDSIESIIKIAAVDSTEIKIGEKDRLHAEYLRLELQLDEERKKLTDLPVYQEYLLNTKIRDSLSKAKFAERVTPAVSEEIKRNQELRSAFYSSPEYLKNKAEWDRLSKASYQALKKQPEMAAFDKDYNRLRDSVSNSMMQTLGLTRMQLEKNPEWRNWSQNLLKERDVLELKLSGIPEIKALNDSSENARSAIYNIPAYEELTRRTMPSQEYIDITNSPEMVRQRVIVGELYRKFRSTPEWKKANETGKKRDEIVQKLKKL